MMPDGFVLEIGGVRFEGRAPDVLAPASHAPWATPERFALNAYGGVTDCRLEWAQPIKLLDRAASAPAIHASLWVQAQLQGDDALYTFGLELGDALISTHGQDWEDMVCELARAAGGVRLECCSFCARCVWPAIGGAQPPVGDGRCLLGHEEALPWASHDRGRLHDLLERAAPPRVAELYVCPHFIPHATARGAT